MISAQPAFKNMTNDWPDRIRRYELFQLRSGRGAPWETKRVYRSHPVPVRE